MKPNRSEAMHELIHHIREIFPFQSADANVCTGQCNSCGFKLLEFLDIELEGWETRLKTGDIPSFGDIEKLAKISKKIYRTMDKNNLVD